MSLTSALTDEFDGKARNRGWAYYKDGAVSILEGDAQHVIAAVQGSEDYCVRLARRPKSVSVSCTCPHYLDHGIPCKHLWAALVAAELAGHLGAAQTPARLELVMDDPPEEDGASYTDDFDDEDEDDLDELLPAMSEQSGSQLWQGLVRLFTPKTDTPPKVKPAAWRQLLTTLENAETEAQFHYGRRSWPADREVVYVLDVEGTLHGNGLALEVGCRDRKKDGNWSKPKFQRIPFQQVEGLLPGCDREILALLAGAHSTFGYGYGYGYYDMGPRYALGQSIATVLLPRMCQTGRCFLRKPDASLTPLAWDEGPAWQFWMRMERTSAGKDYTFSAEFRRDGKKLPLEAPDLLVKGGLLFHHGRVGLLDDSDAFGWIGLMRRTPVPPVPVSQGPEFLQQFLRLNNLPRLELPEELRFEEISPVPQPVLKVRRAKEAWRKDILLGEPAFDYAGKAIPAHDKSPGVFHSEQRQFMRRNPASEQHALAQLRGAGFRAAPAYDVAGAYELKAKLLPKAVRALTAAGWRVEAEGKLYRQPGEIKIEVNSGIDWFELHGTVQFGETTAALPALLAALKRGEDTVQLGDGSFGMLPQEWLKKYSVLAGLGTAEKDHLRFTKSQVGLLDALLASQPEATCDAVFTQARERLRQFDGVQPAQPPASFQGTLRGYQRDGLGWLHFLRDFGFGGCLADDMGLGKTVQVLALLDARRQHRQQTPNPTQTRPALVVVPRSLVFNWKQEAARFTPELRVLDHTGLGRSKEHAAFNDYDLVLTTYGTLRRDALLFKEASFDYCILDEAQAIKNANTESAKAARLLRGNHRLAMSGTPVENHLGELWSLFEFLNPGMLGAASVFQLTGAGRQLNPEVQTLLAKALRPFILRRTKEQVAKDLPQKTEQTLYCELEAAQRKQYDQLREHYRQALLGRIEREGINKAKIQILEALLRLRQAACHPGLIDKNQVGEPSAKLDALLPQLQEVREEGHKALVFSQFTSMLAIVRDRLDREHIPYEYLDGRTRDRAARVERFQNDPNCLLFLISLKAGGLGLNLTAAEYVFLLDPWWNPAVEAQAIDRTHRIGQTRPVFAYRIIARDTVEEKVLELQKTKRDVADAIINADNSLIRNLGREELELLLS